MQLPVTYGGIKIENILMIDQENVLIRERLKLSYLVKNNNILFSMKKEKKRNKI